MVVIRQVMSFKGKFKDSNLLIGVDKGCDILRQYEIKPDYILGDFDSADSITLNYFEKLGTKN